MKIGLLSDTHGYLDPAIFTHFEACDEIWHAGDVGPSALLDELETFKPLRVVYGNIDGKDVRCRAPEILRFRVEEVEVMMIHIGGYPGKYAPGVKKALLEQPAQLFISGHSHILKAMFDPALQCLHLNPGAAGKRGWHKVRTLMRFEINAKRIEHLEVIELRSPSTT
jgi:putative phosphoesterase